MTTYIARRLLITIPMLLAISVITFFFINVAPGDPVDAMIDPERGQEAIENKEALRRHLGLDKPVPVRYVIWLREIVQGNFGYSYHNGLPVLSLIYSRFWATMELTTTAIVIATLLGTLFGVIAALRQYSAYDYGLTVASLFGISIPTFFFALMALYAFSARFELLPAFGMYKAMDGYTITSNLHHLIMPASVLAIDSMAGNTRFARTAMLEVLKADYVTTARSKGLSEFVVISRHAFRNALLPLITITMLRLPGLIGGAILVEYMFSWPGMGRMSLDAIHARDYPVLMGLTFIGATLVLLANLIADILYAYVDPRIRQP